MLTLEVGISSNLRGPGHWRFDNNLLRDAGFKEKLVEHINLIKEDLLSNPNSQWEWIEFKIKTFSIQYSLAQKREQKKEVKDLQNRLQLLANNNDLRGSLDILEEVNSIKHDLKERALLQANKSIFRANWAMAGEKPMAYFLGLEKRRSKDTTITALLDSTGRILTSNQDILEIQRSYFIKIYKEALDSLDSLEDIPIATKDVPTISDLSKISLDLPFTVEGPLHRFQPS